MSQPKTRSHIAIAAQFRNSAGAMDKRGKGRSKRDKRSRQSIKSDLRRTA